MKFLRGIDMENLFDITENKKTITRQRVFKEHTCYLTGVIENTEQYLELFEVLKVANEGDCVKIVIDCYGGDVSVGYTIIQHILEAIENGVEVTASVGRNCASMATVVCMYCNNLELFPWSNMLIHSGHEGHYGAMNENKKTVEFSFKEGEKDLRRDYEHFLSPEEIDHLINNSEPLLLDAEQIQKRWNHKLDVLSNEQKEAPEQINLEDYVKDKIDEVLIAKGLIEKPKTRRKKEKTV